MSEQKIIKLDLGCGNNKKQPDADQIPWIGVDSISFPAVDVVLDLCEKNKSKKGTEDTFKSWPWEDNSVDEIHCSHFIEHLYPEERVNFVNEVYRILKPGAKAQIIAPHWASARAYGDMTHCFSDDTEILTKSGWKLISKTQVGEEVIVLDLATEKTSFSKILQIINQPYNGKMLNFKTDCLDLMVTPNHDMVWRSKGNGKKYKKPKLHKSSADTFLNMGGHHPRKGIASMQWEGENPEKIRIAPDEIAKNGKFIPGEFNASDLMKLIGWFIAEGNVEIRKDGHYQITIAQSSSANKNKVEIICQLIRRLGFSPRIKPDRVSFSSKSLSKYLKKYDTGSANKILPPEIKNLSSNLLKDLLEAAIMGDGSENHSSNSWRYATTSPKLAADIHEIALKAGYRANTCVEKRKGTKIVGKIVEKHKKDYFANNDMNFVYIYKSRDLWYSIPKEVEYSGNQVCVFVADHHNIMVRRNGKSIWSGNCWPPVSEFFFYYLSKDWRATNAPHSNYNENVNFSCTWGYSLHPSLQVRNQEYQNFALQFWKEAAQDIVSSWQKA